MKRKSNETYVYYGIIFLSLLIVWAVVLKGEKRGGEELEIESKLPNRTQEVEAETGAAMIRVVIKTNGFREIVHTEIKLQAEGGLVVTAGEEKKEYGQGEVFTAAPDDVMFQKGTIKVEPAVSNDKIVVASLNRGYGMPSYRGTFELFTSAEGIILVNELPLEEYLYAVVICMQWFQARCRHPMKWKRLKHRRSVREVMRIIRRRRYRIRNTKRM